MNLNQKNKFHEYHQRRLFCDKSKPRINFDSNGHSFKINSIYAKTFKLIQPLLPSLLKQIIAREIFIRLKTLKVFICCKFRVRRGEML